MRIRLLFVLLGVWLAASAASAVKPPVTAIYLVRHAEKDPVSTPDDPPLAPAGEARARLLAQYMLVQHPAALFTTDTRRTRATLAPLALATNLVPQVYNPKNPDALAGRIYQEYAGKTVVVAGHADTLLPLLAAFGVTPPMTEIKPNEYSYLFKIELRPGERARLKVSRYGER